MRKQGLALVAIALVGGGLWWWLHRSHDAETSAPPAKGSAAPVAGQRGAPRGGDREEPQAVVVEDDPKGDLRLEGVVFDADEHPVGGATVVLTSNPPREAITEADGGFAFDGLVGRPYTLVARAKTGIAGPVTAQLTVKSPPVELHLRPGAKVTVQVAASVGKPVDGANVELRGDDSQKA